MMGSSVTSAMLDALVAEARDLPRGRKHLNLHGSPDEPCQRLLNAVEPGSYIRPHRHAHCKTAECLLAIRGDFALILFSDDGEIEQVSRFGRDEADIVIAEVRPDQWHTVIALTPGAILFETKSGPYTPADAKAFADWAPPEMTPAADVYLAALRTRAGLR